MIIMGKRAGVACILLGLCFISAKGICQETQSKTIPSVLLRPERGESPRYPRDLVIGELGQGESSDEAYKFARDLLSALSTGVSDAPVLSGTGSLITKDIADTILSIAPRGYRLGGGRIEADGSVSFLLRFYGSEESITGEMFIRQEEQEESEDKVPAKKEKWFLDDFILEDIRALSEIRDSYRYDFSPYERFF